MTKAAIYIRVSTDEQNPKNELEGCMQLCKTRGWEIEGIYEDKGISAYKDKGKQVNKQILMEKARKGEIKHIVVWSIDRWTRKGGIELLTELNILLSYGCQLHSVKEQWLDELNIPGEIGIHVRNFLTGIVGWMAKLESIKISERVKASIAFKKAKKEGKVGRPTIEEKKGNKIIKEIIRLRDEEGLSFAKIAKKLGIGKSTAYEKYMEVKHGNRKDG